MSDRQILYVTDTLRAFIKQRRPSLPADFALSETLVK